MLIRPFFSYYGGKWRDALSYPAPLHDTIIEPFAGSAGYALRHHARKVVLCDTDEHIVGVWDYLINVSELELAALPDVGPEGTATLGVCQEARWLIGFWLNKGAAAPCKKPSSWMRSGRYPGSFWGHSVRLRIARQLYAIRHWRINLCSYHDAPVDGQATWFVDPPYAVAGSHYRHGSGALDFAALGAWCRSRPGQTIVCENDGATWLPFRPLASVKTSRRLSRSAEAIWVSEPQEAQQDLFGAVS